MTRRSIHLAVVAGTLLCAACGSSSPDPAEKRGASASAGAAVPSAWEPERVEIVDHWYGLEGDTPHNAEYVLTRGANGAFTGTASLSRGADDRQMTSGPLPVTVPDTAMRAFVRELAAVPRRADEYTPDIPWTDDYPALSIRLRAGTDSVEFYSESQPKGRVPWRVTVGGQRYMSDSPAPSRALRHVAPFLRRAELDSIIDAKPGAVRWGRCEDHPPGDDDGPHARACSEWGGTVQ
ncbi:MAG TPA: hypothetical protein VFS20_06510 [Longimicrobium sp.]|nr:hypothetical protein [Longimicrobium sp.]